MEFRRVLVRSKVAGVPIIGGISKIDKENANPQRGRERLLEHGLVVEDMGGDFQDVEVSALKKIGLDALIDKVMLQAEIMEMKANPDRAAEGTVIEAKLDKGRGPVATILVNRGTLNVGDIFVVGAESGKVRAMIDDKGKNVKTAGPSVPVEVRSEEHTSELQSLMRISYAVFCLKKKTNTQHVIKE